MTAEETSVMKTAVKDECRVLIVHYSRLLTLLSLFCIFLLMVIGSLLYVVNARLEVKPKSVLEAVEGLGTKVESIEKELEQREMRFEKLERPWWQRVLD